MAANVTARIPPVTDPEVILMEKLHGYFLWASMSLLMPIALILIRMAKKAREEGRTRRVEQLYYSHLILQLLAVALATVGAIPSFIKFTNKFNYTHQKLGLLIYILVWLQPLTGFIRPDKGTKFRPLWYFVHWFVGTGTVILGIVDTFSGLHSYEIFNLRSTRIWKILFAVQIIILSLIYLYQDRWVYLMDQGPCESKPSAESKPTSAGSADCEQQVELN